MLKNFKLSQKISLGFIFILLLTSILSGIGIYNMKNSSDLSFILDKKEIPQLKIAMELRASVNRLRYAMRGYAYTQETTFFSEAKKEIKILEGILLENNEINKEFSNSSGEFESKLEKIENSKNTYIESVSKLVNINEKISSEVNLMTALSEKYENKSSIYLKSQRKKLETSITRNRKQEAEERIQKIYLVNEIINITTFARIANLKSQTLRNIQFMEEGINKFNEISKILKSLKLLTTQESDIELLDEIESSLLSYKKEMNTFLNLWIEKETVTKELSEIGVNLISYTISMADFSLKNTQNISLKTFKSLNNTSLIVIVGNIFTILFGIIISILIVKSITKPIIRIVNELGNGSEQVLTASDQLSLASQELAEGSSEQASSIEETSSTLDQTSSMVTQNTENTKQATFLSLNAKEAAETGSHEMDEMMNAMNEIKNSSDEISKIIKVIDDIAFQTNILALNAAVEAARAGDAGMGFAVVAEEVRNLAQRSAQAAKDTSSMIEKSIVRANKGVNIARRVSEALVNIKNHSEKVNEIMDEITTASQEQSQGVIQITKAVSQMEEVTQNIASNAEESAASSEELSAQAQNMKQIVNQLIIMVYGNSKIKNNFSKDYKNEKSKKNKPKVLNIESDSQKVLALEKDSSDL